MVRFSNSNCSFIRFWTDKKILFIKDKNKMFGTFIIWVSECVIPIIVFIRTLLNDKYKMSGIMSCFGTSWFYFSLCLTLMLRSIIIFMSIELKQGWGWCMIMGDGLGRVLSCYQHCRDNHKRTSSTLSRAPWQLVHICVVTHAVSWNTNIKVTWLHVLF